MNTNSIRSIDLIVEIHLQASKLNDQAYLHIEAFAGRFRVDLLESCPKGGRGSKSWRETRQLLACGTGSSIEKACEEALSDLIANIQIRNFS